MENLHKRKNEPWGVLEFFRGIGGMAGVNGKTVEAFDINDVANDVYQHNFSHRPYQGNIQSLTAPDLDSYEARAWILSPLCQPYTQQGLQKHSADARAFSFLKILELIPHTLRSPAIETLDKSDYVLQEFILSPLQFGVPYSSPLFEHVDNTVVHEQEEGWDKLFEYCEPIDRFLEFKKCREQVDTESSIFATANVSTNGFEASTGEANQSDLSSVDQYFVPVSLIERWGSAIGILV